MLQSSPKALLPVRDGAVGGASISVGKKETTSLSDDGLAVQTTPTMRLASARLGELRPAYGPLVIIETTTVIFTIIKFR